MLSGRQAAKWQIPRTLGLLVNRNLETSFFFFKCPRGLAGPRSQEELAAVDQEFGG